jgi:hypothetical protein
MEATVYGRQEFGSRQGSRRGGRLDARPPNFTIVIDWIDHNRRGEQREVRGRDRR